jgi:arylsulfatase A-like enzyme
MFKQILMAAALFASFEVGAVTAVAQQVTGVPGSPSATTTIDGKQLPPPPPKFGGVIKESGKDSRTWWPPRVGSPEGSTLGTPNQLTVYNGVLDVPVVEQLTFYDTWGWAATYPHMAVAWSWAVDTPFKYTKQIASHFGGTLQGLAISWLARIKHAGGIRHQFHHIIDIVPTILEAARIKAPAMVNGIKRKPIAGVSMVYTFDKAQCALDAQDPVLRNDC